jgi:hypothetical protein
VARWCGLGAVEGGPARRGEVTPPYNRLACRLAFSGPLARLGNARARRRQTDRRVLLGAVRWRGVPDILGMHAAWGRGDLGERALRRRARVASEAKGCGREAAPARGEAWRARGSAGAVDFYSMCPCSNALNFKNLYRSVPSGE